MQKKLIKIHFLLEFQETIKSRWFHVYFIFLFLMMIAFSILGISDSKMLGFTGLGRVLLLFIQISIILFPIFILVTIAKTFVSDRESGVWEYNLSLPTDLRSFYYGKAIGRYLAMILPIMIAMFILVLVNIFKQDYFSLKLTFYYSLLLYALIFCFMGISFCLSVFVRSLEYALSGAFIIWIFFETFVDIILLGMMVKERFHPNLIMGLALLNPLQDFRIASISLFDPDLSVLGTLSYSLLDILGLNFILCWAIIWPCLIGSIFFIIGFYIFKKRDLL